MPKNNHSDIDHTVYAKDVAKAENDTVDTRIIYKILTNNRKPNAQMDELSGYLNLAFLARKVTEVDLSNANLLPIDIENLCAALKRTPFLKSLNLSNNQIDSQSAQHILNMLHENDTLEYINLQGNKIDSRNKENINTLLETNRNFHLPKNHNLQSRSAATPPRLSKVTTNPPLLFRFYDSAAMRSKLVVNTIRNFCPRLGR